MNQPLLSVLVLNYNYAHFLDECLQSLTAQTLQDMEIIVLDDRSSDDSVAVARKYESDARLRVVVHEVNRGFCASLIEGTEELSSGKYLAVVSADDFVLDPKAFERQVELLEEHPTATYCFSSFTFVRPDGDTVHESFDTDVVRSPKDSFRDILFSQGVWPPHSGTVLRAESYRAVGGYRRDIAMPVDLAMWFDLALVGGFVYASPSFHVWRLHGNQMTTSKTRANLREIVQVIREACADGEQAGYGTGRAARKAIGTHLAAFTISEAFAGNRSEALTRWRASVREAPVPALMSGRLWIACGRAVLGERLYNGLARTLRRPHRALRRMAAPA
jgi:glycosyltransferase involved in cell wall biosynthesis